MDNLFDRAHDLIDKAQEKMASATSQAAWTANQTLVVKGLEGQLNAVQSELDRLVVELGQRSYEAWKSGTSDPRLDGFCRQIDGLRDRRAALNHDLNAARNAVYDPRAMQSAWQPGMATAPPALAPASPPPAIAPPPPPSYVAPAAPPYVAPVAPQTAPPPVPAPPPAPQRPVPPQAAAPVEPPRPTPRARECPNCGHFVPSGVEYCPSCGLRVT